MKNGQRIGPYTLVERLGAGGIGEVWKARDSRLNRVVAIKFITAARQGSSPAAELLREARAASALNHPNIITIFDVGESEAGTYLAMEFVEGETLRLRLKRPPVPQEEALDIAGQISDGLAAAHRKGIIHRDLKPENVMLRADGYVKLLDFGLAKVLPWAEPAATDAATATGSSLATESGQLVGTLTYMSPEQARGQRVTPASDVFSCGIVFYELFTGEHPFRAATPLDTLTAILHSEPPPVGSRSTAVPEQISNVIARALRKEAAERFPSAEELRAQLQQARAAASTAPAEVAPPRHKPRWMQAIGAVLMAALLAGGTWLFRSSSRAPGGAPAVESMAVMSFRAEEDDTRTAMLARGLAEDLNAALARTGFHVAPGSSVAALGSGVEARMAGMQLGVDAVMEGTVRSYGNRLKVHIELVSTRTGFQVWSGSFAVDAEDLLTGEQKAAAQIAEEIRAGLAARGP